MKRASSTYCVDETDHCTALVYTDEEGVQDVQDPCLKGKMGTSARGKWGVLIQCTISKKSGRIESCFMGTRFLVKPTARFAFYVQRLTHQ